MFEGASWYHPCLKLPGSTSSGSQRGGREPSTKACHEVKVVLNPSCQHGSSLHHLLLPGRASVGELDHQFGRDCGTPQAKTFTSVLYVESNQCAAWRTNAATAHFREPWSCLQPIQEECSWLGQMHHASWASATADPIQRERCSVAIFSTCAFAECGMAKRRSNDSDPVLAGRQLSPSPGRRILILVCHQVFMNGSTPC